MLLVVGDFFLSLTLTGCSQRCAYIYIYIEIAIRNGWLVPIGQAVRRVWWLLGDRSPNRLSNWLSSYFQHQVYPEVIYRDYLSFWIVSATILSSLPVFHHHPPFCRLRNRLMQMLVAVAVKIVASRISSYFVNACRWSSIEYCDGAATVPSRCYSPNEGTYRTNVSIEVHLMHIVSGDNRCLTSNGLISARATDLTGWLTVSAVKICGSQWEHVVYILGVVMQKCSILVIAITIVA